MKVIGSKEELLGMPESSYMNEQQLDFFERYINEEIRNCQNMVGSIQVDIYNLKENGNVEIIDQANTINELSLKTTELNNNHAKIKSLERALKRIADGSYGYCLESGDEIGLKRLLVNPAISLTVDEQERLEKLSKQFY